jgi:hypothetical protein
VQLNGDWLCRPHAEIVVPPTQLCVRQGCPFVHSEDTTQSCAPVLPAPGHEPPPATVVQTLFAESSPCDAQQTCPLGQSQADAHATIALSRLQVPAVVPASKARHWVSDWHNPVVPIGVPASPHETQTLGTPVGIAPLVPQVAGVRAGAALPQHSL